MRSLLRQLLTALHDMRVSWKRLALTDITCKLVTFILLTPLVSVVFRILVRQSGRTVLADEDILAFLLEPVGLACAVVIGALTTAVVALEQVALMGIVCAADQGHPLSVTGALRLAGARAWPVLRLAARVVVLTLLAVAPCLAAAGCVYWALLTEYDINYYLAWKPPAFWAAASMAVVLGIAMAAVLLRLATSWCCALPLVCFEGTAPRRALRLSRDRVQGHRYVVVLWIVVWLVTALLLSSLVTSAVVLAGQMLVSRVAHSLLLVLLTVSTLLVVWGGLNLLVNLLSTTSLAVVIFRLYRSLGAPRELNMGRLAAATHESSRRMTLLAGRGLALSVLAGTILAGTLGVLAIGGVSSEDRCEVIAHRGASGSAPENTMAAVRQAVEDQADWVEIDVQESADGEVVVFHDSDFMKLARHNLNIWNARDTDLQEIDIGSWFHADYRNERVPTLAEVLTCCRGQAGVLIELKYYGHDKYLETRVVEMVETHDMQSQIMIMSLQQPGIQKIKQLRPVWRTGLLSAVAVGDLTRAPADFLAVKATLATRAFIRSAHRRNKKVYAWTVNDPVSMSTLIGRGVDGIITDYPAVAREVLAERTRMSWVERLLITLSGRLGIPPQMGEQ